MHENPVRRLRQLRGADGLAVEVGELGLRRFGGVGREHGLRGDEHGAEQGRAGQQEVVGEFHGIMSFCVGYA
ncbi:hypothetical protein KDD17_10950 [Sulfitobacter albidus]|uniref:Uncharacterized protein n=1 Tax=Sulfitobacter albidus TaxID=2829501 RepID=A0A975JBQ1_9RHOB|nr:hypothetical protein [Sulfitobacter albidus]QUJ75488.1 hypothetical protein KDD17_10950 [Sulfitobacter albidus]